MNQALLLFGFFVLFSLSVPAQRVVAERAITVPAGNYTLFTFNYTQTTRLWGRFKATGGKNDIECYVLDDDGLENFKNNNQFRAYYASGRVTVATFDLNLGRGTYHLVFNNKWSVLTPKAVHISFYEEDRKP